MPTTIGFETEFCTAPPGSSIAERCKRDLIEPLPLDQRDDPDPKAAAIAVRKEVQTVLQNSRPRTAAETATLERWRKEARDFDETDLICARIQLSRSLVPLTPPSSTTFGQTYQKVLAPRNSTPSQRLQPRWGKGTLQSGGFFDQRSVGEVSTTPMPLESEHAQQADADTSRLIAETAGLFGHRAYILSRQVSAAHYGADGAPLLGDPNENFEPYRRLAAALCALYMEGAFVEPAQFASMPATLGFDIDRVAAVRMMPGRMEWRAACSPAVVRGLGMAMRLAFEEPHVELDTASVGVGSMLRMQRQDTFTKTKDLMLYRTLECAEIIAGGHIALRGPNDDRRAASVLATLLEKNLPPKIPHGMALVATLLQEACVVQGEFLAMSDRSLAEACAQPGVTTLARELGVRPEDSAAINARLRRIRILGNTPIVRHCIDLPNAGGPYAVSITRQLEQATIFPRLDPNGYGQALAQLRTAKRYAIQNAPRYK